MRPSFCFLIAILWLGSCCKSKEEHLVSIVDNTLLQILEDFQRREIPEKDRIILLELYEISPRRVYEISKIEYPYQIDSLNQYFISSVNAVPVFISSPYTFQIDMPYDTTKVRKIVEKMYVNYLNESDYEIHLDSILYKSWYYASGNPYFVFNMRDSVAKYGNVNLQYQRLDHMIE